MRKNVPNISAGKAGKEKADVQQVQSRRLHPERRNEAAHRRCDRIGGRFRRRLRHPGSGYRPVTPRVWEVLEAVGEVGGVMLIGFVVASVAMVLGGWVYG